MLHHYVYIWLQARMLNTANRKQLQTIDDDSCFISKLSCGYGGFHFHALQQADEKTWLISTDRSSLLILNSCHFARWTVEMIDDHYLYF